MKFKVFVLDIVDDWEVKGMARSLIVTILLEFKGKGNTLRHTIVKLKYVSIESAIYLA